MIIDVESEDASPDKLMEKRNETINVIPLQQTSGKNESEKESNGEKENEISEQEKFSLSLKHEEKDEFGLPINPREDPIEQKEVDYLRSLCNQEKGHGQWLKQGMNFFCLTITVIIGLMRGKGN